MIKQTCNVAPCIPKAWAEGVEKLLNQMEEKAKKSETTYTYYFRSAPDLTMPMPEGLIKVNSSREPDYNTRFHCYVYGNAVFRRSLSIEEQHQHDLIPEPRNHLPGVMKG